jgi:hypothetical protein
MYALDVWSCSAFHAIAHLAAALCSDFWHRWKRSSFKPCAKAYLVAMMTVWWLIAGAKDGQDESSLEVA